MNLSVAFENYTLPKNRITPRSEIIDEIYSLAQRQECKLDKRTFFVLLAPYQEDDLRYILSVSKDKVRQGFLIEKYLKWLRKN